MPSAASNNLRVAKDTNVYFSALTHPGGVPFKLWQKAIQRRYVLLTSPPIMREIARVLRIQAGWEDTEIVSFLKLLVRVAQIVSPDFTLKVIAEDEPDNRVLECAVAGKASLIVSGDLDLRRLKSFQGIAIVRPVDLLRTLK
jgi:putative PIN family toxin of toxin-antitoxin system